MDFMNSITNHTFFWHWGLISWFCADFTLLYYYYALGLEEQKLVSFIDGLWFLGYGFLSLHLFVILRSLHNIIKRRIVIIVLIISLLFVGYNVHILLSSEEFIVEVDFGFYCHYCLSYFRFGINRSFWCNTNKFTQRLSTVYSLVSFFIVFVD